MVMGANCFVWYVQTRFKIDTSSEGLGVLLEQNHGTLTYPKWYPIGYVSQSLRDYEERYAQVEKETQHGARVKQLTSKTVSCNQDLCW